jgi:hypothetical protein
MFGRTGEAISIEAMLVRRACEAVAFHSVPARRTGKAVVFEALAFGAARVMVSFEAPMIGRTRHAVTIETVSVWGTCKSLALEFAAARGGEMFAIETASRRWTVETAALVATTFGASGETAIVATAPFQPRPAWTSRTAMPPHALMDGFGHLHEFVLAKLAVFIFVELLKHLGGIRWLWTAAAVSAASGGGAAFSGFAAAFSARLVALFFARFGAFFII